MSNALRFVRRHLVMTLAFVIALAGTAFAAGGGIKNGRRAGAAHRVFACVESESAELQLSTAGGTCPSGERKVSWNARGVRGRRGERGARGRAGTTGKPGPEGRPGAPGAQGKPGATGAQGPAGLEGKPGATGAQGPAGLEGKPGTTGKEGSPGAQGKEGPAGSEGKPGKEGKEGPEGKEGKEGPEGKAASSEYGYGYLLATIANATVLGGADVPFSNNGPLSGITHTAETTTFIVSSSGTYRIGFNLSLTAGIGSELALAVNGVVDASTPISVETATGEVSGQAILTLAAGDVVTLRNNSAVPLTITLAPSVGAEIVFQRLA